jgi:hypothetical protein
MYARSVLLNYAKMVHNEPKAHQHACVYIHIILSLSMEHYFDKNCVEKYKAIYQVTRV